MTSQSATMLPRVLGIALAAGAVVAAPAVMAATIVPSNMTAPGDSFTNPGPTNQGQAVGAGPWHYNNVRGGGAVGIRTDLPRSGNGSVFFSSPTSAGKADIEFLPNAVNIGGNFISGGSLGAFSALTSFGYDWYRVGTSTNPPLQHPALRVLLDLDGNLMTPDRAGLVFERAYNGGVVPVDTWVTDTIAASSNLWSFGALGFELDIDGPGPGSAYVGLATWQAWFTTNHPNAVIVGFSAGVGSGWHGVFTGAVDNITWTIGGQTASYNFEVAAVPEPAALALFGLGLLGLAAARRLV
jgi:hypothetical protein